MSHSLVDLPADVLRDPLLGILRARLAREDLISLSLTSRAFAILLRPFIFESLTFRERGSSAKDRVDSLASASTLMPLVQRLVFEPAPTEGDDGEDGAVAGFWSAFLELVPRLFGLRAIICDGTAMPPDDFWYTLIVSGNVHPKALEVKDAFANGGPPPSLFKVRGLSFLQFSDDRKIRDEQSLPLALSIKVKEMVFRNRHTLEKLEIFSSRLALNEVLVPSSDDAYSPTFPAIALLEIGVDCRPIAHGSDAQTQMDQIVDWFHDLSLHLPELDTLILRSGVCAPWLIATPLQLLAGNAMRITTHDLLSALLAQLASLGTQTLPSTPVTMPPRLLARETVPHLQRVRRLVLAPLASSPGSRLSDVRLSSLGRQDVFDLFAAIKALAALEELSITLGEVDVEMLAGLADAAGCGKLRSLEIDLRLPDHQPEQVEHEIDGDGLLWGTELQPLAAALSPLARTLLSLTVADNRATAARSLLFDGDVPYTPAGDTFNFEPTLVTFARQLWNLTSVRWVTRDGREEDALVRDQLWVVAVGGGWMRLVG